MIDVEKLRGLLQAATPAALVVAANALPELLAVYEAACAWREGYRGVHRDYRFAYNEQLAAAVDAARKAGT